jgi:hypothetical protein
MNNKKIMREIKILQKRLITETNPNKRIVILLTILNMASELEGK